MTDWVEVVAVIGIASDCINDFLVIACPDYLALSMI